MNSLSPNNFWPKRFLNFFFFHLYRDWAWTYDGVAGIVSVGQWKEWVFSSLPQIQGPTVLELGHGPGHLQEKLADYPWKVYGIDSSPQMGKIALKRMRVRRKTISGGYAKNSSLVRCRAEFLPFPDSFFNTVVATFPSDYIFAPATLNSVYRVLKPGGQLVVLLTAWITGTSLPFRIAGWLFRTTGESSEMDPKWSQPIREAGFEPAFEWIELEYSRVLMIRVSRPRSSPPQKPLLTQHDPVETK